MTATALLRATSDEPAPELLHAPLHSTLHSTLLDALVAAAQVGEALGVTLLPESEEGEPTRRSYASLLADAGRLASALRGAGVKEGERIVLVLPTSFEFLIAFFGVLLCRAVPVPAYPMAALEKTDIALEKIAHIARHCRAPTLLTRRSLKPLLGELLLRVPSLRRLRSVEGLLRDALGSSTPTLTPGPGSPEVAARGEDLALIQYTSGSTGKPKGVALTHQNVLANIHAAGLAGRIDPGDVMVSWLPLYHDMGLIGGLLWPVYWQLPLVLMSPTAFLMRPSRWLKAISDYGGTVSMAPNFAYALCVKRVRPSEREGLDLSRWRAALNGAEPVSLHTLRDFQEAFGPCGFKETAFFPSYGLAESTVAVTFSAPGQPFRHRAVDRLALAAGRVIEPTGDGAMTLVCAGRPVPGHEVAIVDDRGSPVAEGRVGNVVVRGPSVMRGYHRDGAATRRALRDGWLWTGDLGFLMPEGLYVTGRAKDLIIVRGKNFYAEDVERVAERVPGARSGGSVAFGLYDEERAKDLAVLVCETKVADEEARATLAAAVREAVSERTGLALDDVVLVPPGTLPKTSSGKRQRSLCRERYLTGRLAARPRTHPLALAKVFARSAAGFLSRLR